MKTKTKPQKIVSFSFWKNNRIDRHFKLTESELIEKFVNWKEYQLHDPERSFSWWEYYYGSQLVRAFITDKELKQGLESVFDEKEWETIYETLRNYLDPKK